MAVDKTKDILVGGILHSIATGNIIAHADEVMDEDYGKKQSEINQELSSRLTEELKDYLPLTGGTLTGNLTAPIFIGDLQGTATKATQDASGNVITTTYATKEELTGYLPLAGGTMTGNITFESASDSNGHEYVDLGLPSGNLWAKCNIGANTEEEGGLYFQWGDTQGYTAEQVGDGEGLKAFRWADYKFSIDGSSSNFSKYNKSDGKVVLDPEDDAAHVNMGGNWRMPTFEECKELCLNTDIYLVPTEGEEIQGTAQEQSGSIMINWASQAEGTLKGVKFYKKGDKQTYMFVPVSGVAFDGSVQFVGESGNLWASSLNSSDVQSAWSFGFDAGNGSIGSGYRYGGLPVRGILSSNTENSKGIIIEGKSETDLLNAGGSTTSISDIISLANVPTNVSDLNNDSNFQTASQVTTTVNNAIDALVNGAPEAMDTLKELSDALNDQEDAVAAINQTLATKVATINASGTYPLTLSANKSGTTVNLTGSIASGKISANSILINQDLNNYNDISHVGYYYAGGGNAITNKPSGIDSFGMVILRTAVGIVTQIIYGQIGFENNALEIYYRIYHKRWFSWKQFASTEDLDNYATTEALTSGLDKKANSTHTHDVADISGLSNVATSGSYNDLDDTPTIATSSQDGLMSAADKTKLDTMQQQLTTKSTITWIELD